MEGAVRTSPRRVRPEMPQLKRWNTAEEFGGPPLPANYPQEFVPFLHAVGSPEYKVEEHTGRNRPGSPMGLRVRQMLKEVEDRVSGTPKKKRVTPDDAERKAAEEAAAAIAATEAEHKRQLAEDAQAWLAEAPSEPEEEAVPQSGAFLTSLAAESEEVVIPAPSPAKKKPPTVHRHRVASSQKSKRAVMGGGFSATNTGCKCKGKQESHHHRTDLESEADEPLIGYFVNKFAHLKQSVTASKQRGRQPPPLIAVGGVETRTIHEPEHAPMSELVINRRAAAPEEGLETRTEAIQQALGSLASLWRSSPMCSKSFPRKWISSDKMPLRQRSTFSGSKSATPHRKPSQTPQIKKSAVWSAPAQRSGSAIEISEGETRAPTPHVQTPEEDRQEYTSKVWSSPFMRRRAPGPVSSAPPKRSAKDPQRERPATAFEMRSTDQIHEEVTAKTAEKHERAAFVPHATRKKDRSASAAPRFLARTIEHDHQKLVRDVFMREGLEQPPKATVYLHSRPSTAVNKRETIRTQVARTKSAMKRPATVLNVH